MITLTIEQGLFSAIGTVYFAVLGVGAVISAVILIAVLRQRMQQIKKGEQHAYRHY